MTNNVIDLESYKKIGRNQTCLCGSGKKYKHCCYNKEIQFTLDDDVKVVLEIDDTSLDGAKRYLRQTPSSAYTCKDFDVLGVQLHELGYKECQLQTGILKNQQLLLLHEVRLLCQKLALF